MTEESSLKKALPSLLLITITIVLPIISSGLVLLKALENGQGLYELSIWHWGLLALIAGILMGLAILPSSVPLIAGAYYLGYKWFLFYLPAYFLALSIGFFMARFIENGTLLKLAESRPKWKAQITRLQGRSFAMVIMAKFSPVLPFAFLNVVCALAGIRYRTFIAASMIGMLPRALLLTYVAYNGNSMVQLLENTSPAVKWEALGLFIVSTVGMVFIWNRSNRKKSLIKTE
ncbi:MAG: VTT domain-containing protein [Bacteroidota bacterium]